MLTLLVVILHKTDFLPELLDAWKQAGIPGTTILPSMGGYQAVNQLNRGGLSNLLNLLDSAKPQQRMLLSLIDNDQTLEIAVSEAERVVGGFDRPESGILFSMPVSTALGLRKWGDTRRLAREARERVQMGEEEEERVDKSAANLLGWFEEEVRDLHGEKTLLEWRNKRKLKISDVFTSFKLEPTIVSVDTPIREVVRAFLTNPDVPMACVVNREGRLVGVIEDDWFSEMVLVPAIPEKFIQDPDRYEQAIDYARMEPGQLAFDVMREPVFAIQDDTLENAFVQMQTKKLRGLPLVNEHYRVIAYLSMMELLAVYFPEEERKG